jgi:hypothetical protein
MLTGFPLRKSAFNREGVWLRPLLHELAEPLPTRQRLISRTDAGIFEDITVIQNKRGA